jgi:tetratricopeptide (TPR) repeat protein
MRLSELLAAAGAGRVALDEALEQVASELPDLDELAEALASIATAATSATAALRARLVAEAGKLVLVDGVAELICADALNRLRDFSSAESWAQNAIALLPDGSPLSLHARRVKCEALRRGHGEMAYRLARDLDQLADDAKASGAGLVLAMVLLERARFEDESGRPDDAFATAVEAVELRRHAGPGLRPLVRDLSWFCGIKGDLARHAERWDEAIAAFEEARAAAFELHQPSVAAYHLANIGFTWQDAGEYDRGETILKQAAVEGDAAGEEGLAQFWRGEQVTDQRLVLDHKDPSVLRRAMILLNTDPPDVEAAIAELRGFLSAHRGSASLIEQAHARNLLGIAFTKRKEPLQALASMQRAAELAAQAGALRFEAEYRTNAALRLADANRMLAAREQVQLAIQAGERALAEQTSSELRQAVAGALARSYEFLAFSSATHYTPVPSESGPPNALNVAKPPDPLAFFAVSQRLRGLNLLRLLRLSVVVERAGDEVLEEAFARLRSADVALEASALQSDVPLGGLLMERAQQSAAFEMAAGEQGLGAAVGVSSGLHATLSHLGANAVLVDVLSLSEGVAYLAATAGQPPATGLLPWRREDRTRTVSAFLRGCGRQAAYDLPGAEFDPDDRHSEMTVELDDRLFGPLQDAIGAWKADRVFVVPHRELFALPWARLDREVPLTILPAAGAVEPLHDRQRSRSGRWIAVGDPTASLIQTEQELAALPGAERLVPRRESLMAELGTAVRLHLACHGRFTTRNPYRSGLHVLSEDDDRLTVQDIVGRLTLRECWLVFLGACNSALARIHPSNEFTSLPGAFLIAGSRNVVASLWPAHDGAARLLAEELYRSLDGPTQPGVAQALMEARRTVATLDRDEVVARLGDERFVPHRERPFASAVYLDTFQHYGID